MCVLCYISRSGLCGNAPGNMLAETVGHCHGDKVLTYDVIIFIASLAICATDMKTSGLN